MAHAIARGRNITPWQALLDEVRRSAGELAFFDQKIGEAPDDEALLSGGSHNEWLRMRDKARLHAARIAKMALDAGVAERLVESIQSQASQVVRVLNAAILSTELGLSDEQVQLARGIMRREMMALQREQGAITDGEDVIDVESEEVPGADA